MNEDLRRRLAEVMAKHCEGYAPAYFLDYRGIDDVLAEINAAGFVLVERERWERVRERAEWWCDEAWGHRGAEMLAECGLEPGDLDGDV